LNITFAEVPSVAIASIVTEVAGKGRTLRGSAGKNQ
jgi:hypothetical protein